jgi:hypothetical protein
VQAEATPTFKRNAARSRQPVARDIFALFFIVTSFEER